MRLLIALVFVFIFIAEFSLLTCAIMLVRAASRDKKRAEEFDENVIRFCKSISEN